MNRRQVTRFHAVTFEAGRRFGGRDGHARHLTRKAFDLLLLLLERAPAVATKNEWHQRHWPGSVLSHGAF